jgi:hypothetical protein
MDPRHERMMRLRATLDATARAMDAAGDRGDVAEWRRLFTQWSSIDAELWAAEKAAKVDDPDPEAA